MGHQQKCATGPGRATRQQTEKWNQMTALRSLVDEEKQDLEYTTQIAQCSGMQRCFSSLIHPQYFTRINSYNVFTYVLCFFLMR